MEGRASSSSSGLPPARLLLFGDSWAKCESIYDDAWPELLGQTLGWRVVNLAAGHSDSGRLQAQAGALERLVERGLELHEECVALVHTGGNDLWYASGTQFAGTGLLGLVATCGCSCFSPPLLRQIAQNIRGLSERLHDILGVRRFVWVGIPFTPALPMIGSSFPV